MARPIKTGKQSVNLAEGGVRTSRIRRDPPPAVKEIVFRDRYERDRRAIVIGILIFTVALMIINFGFVSYFG